MSALRIPGADPTPYGVEFMRKFGLEPDSWQADILRNRYPRLLLNCCRQAGKSTTVALLAMAETIFIPGTFVVLLSRSHRQSKELFRTLADFYTRVNKPLKQNLSKQELTLQNRSRVISLPCQADTVRGYAGVDLLIIDEAARVPDDLYRAVRPMLAVSNGRLICLSTPYGKRGFFYQAWANGGPEWHRVEVPAGNVPRITADFLDDERRNLGESWFRQEYCCSFESVEGLVYPNFNTCVLASRGESVPGAMPRVEGKRVGGIDFGFRNPFAAIWGTLDHDDVLWLTGEHYARCQPLSFHAAKLPPDVMWYADPSGANEISELTCAGFKVRKGDNTLRTGIAAVTARIQNGRLKVWKDACPNLIAEAGLYRYSADPADRRAEVPVDDHNHALAALRYLVSRLDKHHLATGTSSRRNRPPTSEPPPDIWQRREAWVQSLP
jgi:hypothetical protein